MKILIWNSPFISQGNVFFYKNAFNDHLIPQANTLCKEGHDVDIIIPYSTSDVVETIYYNVNKIFISEEDVFYMLNGFYDPHEKLYSSKNFKFNEIRNVLYKKLNKSYDVILLWETPVPFLEEMYPESLIIHQMPGIFCRPPYPQFTTFDISGLYKNSTLFNSWKDIVHFNSKNYLVKDFSIKVKDIYRKLNIFENKIRIWRKKFKSLSLCPLQVSAHYAFKCDSKYSSQTEFLMDVLRKINKSEGLIVTQYTTKITSDKVIDKSFLDFFNNKNIIYEQIFDKIDSVSQYIVPFIDKVYSVSSSLMFQSFLWNKYTVVDADSHMKPYSNEQLILNGEDISLAQYNTLDFLLNRHQILTKQLLDSSFITPLLEELIHKKKKGLRGVESYCNLSYIDNNYHEKIMNSFRKKRSEKSLLPYFPSIIDAAEQIKRIENAIGDETICVISFDIFDTLISRVLEKPVDLYYFLQERCFLESHGTVDNFYMLRVQAEIESRKCNQNEETTLDAIYTYIQKKFFISKSLLDKIKKYEFECELKFSTPHPLGSEIFQIAKNSGKRIILVSDMYLPQTFIEQLLEKNGYSGYEKLYVSCELGVSKRLGSIYPFIISDLGVSSTSILHFGDNKINDIKMAKENKIKTYYLCNSINRMRSNELYKKIFPPKLPSNKSRSACVGLIALKTFSKLIPVYEKESLFMNSIYLMGYNALGMIIISYAIWIAKRARDYKISTLYFLSREGLLVKKVYDIVSKHIACAPKSKYLYASRRALNMCSIENKSDIHNFALLPFSNGSIVYELIDARFGIKISEKDSIYCFKKLNYTNEDRILFLQICDHLSEKIINNAKEERKGYIAYLESMDCFSSNEIAIVDIGWKARMQVRISKILKRKIRGFYYATITESEYGIGLGNNYIDSFLPPCADAMNSSFILKNRHLCELLICCSEKSLKNIKYNKGKLVKNFEDELNYYNRKNFIEELHSGCVDFAFDFTKFFHEFFETMYISPELSTQVLQSFGKNPQKFDYNLIEGVNFSDEIGGIHQIEASKLIKNTLSIDEKSPHKDTNINSKNTKMNSIKNKESFIRWIEKKVILLLCCEKKQNKYLRNRDAFFNDSKHSFIKLFGKIT